MDRELTEAQFKVLKTLVEEQTFIIMIPNPIEQDAQEMKDHHSKGMQEINFLVETGFLEKITDKFQEMLEEVTKDGGRGFEAYVISPSTVRMFTPGATVN